MKKITIKTTVLLLFPLFLFSQSTERFIRIVGNANYEFEANAAKLIYKVSEIAANEKKGTKHSTFSDVYSDFRYKLDSLNIDSEKITRTDVNLGKYSNNISKTYELYINSISDLEKITSLKIDGVRLNSIKYVYDNIDPAIQENLMMLAIEDAKRKANNICSEIDMELGKILNIEDSSSGCCGDIKDSKEIKTKKKYGLYITFELKDN